MLTLSESAPPSEGPQTDPPVSKSPPGTESPPATEKSLLQSYILLFSLVERTEQSEVTCDTVLGFAFSFTPCAPPRVWSFVSTVESHTCIVTDLTPVWIGIGVGVPLFLIIGIAVAAVIIIQCMKRFACRKFPFKPNLTLSCQIVPVQISFNIACNSPRREQMTYWINFTGKSRMPSQMLPGHQLMEKRTTGTQLWTGISTPPSTQTRPAKHRTPELLRGTSSRCPLPTLKETESAVRTLPACLTMNLINLVQQGEVSLSMKKLMSDSPLCGWHNTSLCCFCLRFLSNVLDMSVCAFCAENAWQLSFCRDKKYAVAASPGYEGAKEHSLGCVPIGNPMKMSWCPGFAGGVCVEWFLCVNTTMAPGPHSDLNIPVARCSSLFQLLLLQNWVKILPQILTEMTVTL